MGIKDVFTKDENKRNFKWIDMELLHSGLDYQRPIDNAFIEDKVKHFDKNEVVPPCVSYRNGKYNVVDGQHTIVICKTVGWKKMKCEVREGLTIEDENNWFVVTNTKHRSQSKNRILNGRYFSGTDKTLNDLIKCLSSVGYKLKTADIIDNLGVIIASDTIENVFCEMGEETFMRFISLHQSIWNGEDFSLQASFLKGFAKFYSTYMDQFEEKRCITVFSKINQKRKTPSDIRKEADDDKYTKDVGIRYAKVLVKYYNSSLSRDNKLKMSKLED